MKRPLKTLFAAAAVLFAAGLASAHISGPPTPSFANTTQEVTFSVGHGCEGADTSAVRTVIPAGVTSVRPMRSDFANPTVEVNGSGAVTAVNWVRPVADLAPADTNFYKLTVRMKLPNAPFTTLYFPTYQTCLASDGGTLSTDWVGTTVADTDAGIEPAPAVSMVPPRKAGWNKYTVPVAVTALGTYFSDARIVWKGSSAYSANPAVVELIANTPDVTPLTSLAAGDEIWVNY